jgi:glycosyltransferase involved in cell wall biosynthesis
MKILHVIASVDPRGGGPIEGLLRQAEVRRSIGVETHIASLDCSDDPWVLANPVKVFALGVQRCPFGGRLSRYGYTPHLVPWLRRYGAGYDVVVVNGLWNYAALGARRALTRSNVPYVVFTHGMLDPWFRKAYPLKHITKQLLWWLSEGPLLAHARAVMFTTREECILARNAFWPYRCMEQVVSYGTADICGDDETQIAAFTRTLPKLGARRFLLFLGRIHPKKGCDLLIEAFAQIAPNHSDVDLVIAGPDQVGWRRDLQEQARALRVDCRIHWAGMLEGDAKWGAFRSCEAFVLPSHQENFGIAAAEAMAAGRAVLITDKVNIWREVETAGAGLVASDDATGVRSLLQRYLSLSAEQKSLMRSHARQCFLQHFEIGRATRAIVDVLRESAEPSFCAGTRRYKTCSGDLSNSDQ